MGFKETQYAFAAHLRDPDNNPGTPGIEDRRLKIYRELFYNNVEGFLKNAFPVIRKLYSDDDWHALVRDYFAHHQAEGPQFYQLAEEFLKFLQQGRQANPQSKEVDPPFLLELAHYEWVEMILAISDEDARVAEGVDPNGDVYAGIPVMSPVAKNLAYVWPVHQLGPDFQPDEPPEQPTQIVVYRDRNDKMHFLVVNVVSSRLLQLIESEPDQTGEAHLLRIAAELGQQDNPENVLISGRKLLEDFRQRDILLGSLSEPAGGVD